MDVTEISFNEACDVRRWRGNGMFSIWREWEVFLSENEREIPSSRGGWDANKLLQGLGRIE